jgi:endonuclease/exonuclease/phosphatase family metal-dependent hydrolase
MRSLKFLAILILTLVLAFAAFLGIITLNDYKPGTIEPAEASSPDSSLPVTDSIFSVVTWNIGYFGLGMKNDFFYDGGKMSRPERNYYEECSEKALDYLSGSLKPDFLIFQEVDINSRRSYRNNQVNQIAGRLQGYGAAAAVNYKVLFVPVPVNNPMGKVESGLLTLSKYKTIESSRYAFPRGFSWPVGLFMLDRCFLLTRIPHPSSHDIVLINTHNEAFDDGSQRRQQMSVLRETMLKEYDKGNYVITGGDWNLNPVGFDPETLATGDIGQSIEPRLEQNFLPAGWQWAFDPEIPTNRNVDQPYVRCTTPTTIIDFFVLSPNISLLEIKTEDLGFQWADHQPVRMKILLNTVNHP